jgi:hypothetical protein
VETEWIDNTPQNSKDVEIIQPKYFEEETQTYIDAAIRDVLIAKRIDCRMRPDYTQPIVINALRQMYSEDKVGSFLEKHPEYECAIVCTADGYLINDINLDHVTQAIENKVYTTVVNDAQGYTNGFYIGALPPLIKILKRFSSLERLLPTDKDYEYLLKKSFDWHNIERCVTDTYFLKIRSNKHIARQGIMASSVFNQIVNELQSKIG